jgi:branched-subunit amino acid ABC-type transport system permease component
VNGVFGGSIVIRINNDYISLTSRIRNHSLRIPVTFDPSMATTQGTTVPPSQSPGLGVPTLVTIDIVVLVVYFLLVLAVGLWVSRSKFGKRHPNGIQNGTLFLCSWPKVVHYIGIRIPFLNDLIYSRDISSSGEID